MKNSPPHPSTTIDSKLTRAMLPAPRSGFLRRRAVVLLSATLLVSLGACRDKDSSAGLDVMDRETFLEVYVDLRSEALRNTTRRIREVERDSVLARHGVEEAELGTFLEVHESDSEFMRDLWNEAEARISLVLQMAGEGGRSGV